MSDDTEMRALKKSWPILTRCVLALGLPALAMSCFQAVIKLPPAVESQGQAIAKNLARIEQVEKGLQEQREIAIRAEERGKRMEEMIREVRDEVRNKSR